MSSPTASSDKPSYGDPDTRGRILATTWDLISEHGAALKLSDVAAGAGVSRQAVYLHFGDRNGLLLALVEHMDETLNLGDSITHVMAAPDGVELLERVMRLNTEFWAAVDPVARVLSAAQYDDEALGAAWRGRMQLRLSVFAGVVARLAADGELAAGWAEGDATAVLYATAHYDTWRELVHQLGWSHDHYVTVMARALQRTLLGPPIM